jgi:hypothetical protein
MRDAQTAVRQITKLKNIRKKYNNNNKDLFFFKSEIIKITEYF